MVELKDLTLLLALARHRHFARAAQTCGMSQPAFSMRIRNIEADLGVEIVRRGNRFEGFTQEGDIALRWAKVLLDAAARMEDELRSPTGTARGQLTIGVIPTALAYAARIPVLLQGDHPELLVRLRSASAPQIQQSIEDGELDAGVTYADGLSPDLVEATPLYEETYVLLAPPAMAPREAGTATWAEAGALPLSLLSQDMQNRRILDRCFADLGLAPHVVAETNALSTCLGLVRAGRAASILPEVMTPNFGDVGQAVTLPLTEPQLKKSICLIFAARDRHPLRIEALRRALAPAAGDVIGAGS